MSSEGSVTQWVRQLQGGDQAAAEKLWENYFQRLVALARKKLEGTPRRAADEEDVALSAFASFCRGAGEGRFPQLHDRDNLWRLLVTITSRKASHLVRDQAALKRGGEAVIASDGGTSSEAEPSLEQIAAQEPTPEFAAQMAEEYRRLLDCLGDAELQSVAVWKMEGYSNEEVAGKLGCAPSTVERRLRLIRSFWEKELTR